MTTAANHHTVLLDTWCDVTAGVNTWLVMRPSTIVPATAIDANTVDPNTACIENGPGCVRM